MASQHLMTINISFSIIEIVVYVKHFITLSYLYTSIYIYIYSETSTNGRLNLYAFRNTRFSPCYASHGVTYERMTFSNAAILTGRKKQIIGKKRDFLVLFLRIPHWTKHTSRGFPHLVLISQLLSTEEMRIVSCSKTRHTNAGVRTVNHCI